MKLRHLIYNRFRLDGTSFVYISVLSWTNMSPSFRGKRFTDRRYFACILAIVSSGTAFYLIFKRCWSLFPEPTPFNRCLCSSIIKVTQTYARSLQNIYVVCSPSRLNGSYVVHVSCFRKNVIGNENLIVVRFCGCKKVSSC